MNNMEITKNNTRKARILLVILEPITLYIYGIRSLSAVLRYYGFDVKILFLFPTQFSMQSKDAISDFIHLCDEYDVIGFSFTSSRFSLACQLTEHIRQELNGKIIAFGGTDPTIDPDRNLEVADVVCIGEGEKSFTEFLLALEAGEGYPNINGIRYKNRRNINANLQPLIHDFTQMPTVDNNFDHHYVTHKGKIVKIEKVARRYLLSNYMTLTSFGCSMGCSYCVNNKMKRTWSDWGKVRRRPVAHIIAELKEAIEKIPWIRTIDLVDDDFGSAPIEYLKEFQREYTKNISLPIDVMGFRPPDIVPEKLDILRDMGVVKLRMGIQAVNQEAKTLFKRKYSNDFLMKKVRLLNKYKEFFYGIRYDFIIDTPWDTKNASIDTLKFISKMPAPFYINIYTLAFYPGTELYKKALDEGLIEPSDVWKGNLNKNFMELKPSWINFLFILNNFIHIPPRILNVLLNRKILEHIDLLPSWLFYIIQMLGFAKRGISYVFHGDLAQIRKLFLYFTEYSFLYRRSN